MDFGSISDGTAVLYVFIATTFLKFIQDWKLGRATSASLKQLTSLVQDHENRLTKLEGR